MSNKIQSQLNDKYLRLFGIPLAVVVVLLLQKSIFYPGNWDLFWLDALISVVFTVLMWELFRVVVVHMRLRFPGMNQTRQRISWQLVLFTIQIGIAHALLAWMLLSMAWAETTGRFSDIWFINFGSSLLIIILLVCLYEAFYFFGQYKKNLLRAEELKKQQAQQRLDTLKNQVNPHFLFNSLTTLSALIGEDVPRAERFVDELSKVYRYLLRAGRHQEVTIADELQFAQSYAFLLKNRFEDGAFSLKLNIEEYYKSENELKLPPDLEGATLPALSLQNALDYLVRTQNLPLHIELGISGNQFRISCENKPKSLAFERTGSDLHQLENYGAAPQLHEGRLVFKIPMTLKPTQL